MDELISDLTSMMEQLVEQAERAATAGHSHHVADILKFPGDDGDAA